MKTKPLVKITLMGKQDEKETIINKLHHLGVMHISEIDKSDFLDRDVPGQNTNLISDQILKLRYIAEKTGVKINFVLDGLPNYEKVLKRSTEFLNSVLEGVKALDVQKKEQLRLQKKYESHIRILSQLPKIYTVRTGYNQVYFSRKLLKSPESIEVVQGKKGVYYYAGGPRQKEDEIITFVKNNSLKQIDLSFVKKDSDLTLKESTKLLESTIEKISQIDSKLFKKINGKQSTLKWLISTLENYYEQGAISQRFGRTELFFVVQGYGDIESIEKIKSVENLSMTVDQVQEAPTLLENKGIVKHFEHLINMYGVPQYNSVDPSLIMAIFYPFFFGFMLSDIGYGLMMMVVLAFLRWHFGPEVKPLLWIFGLSAVSSIIFGLIFGGFFGNLVHVTPLYKDSFTASFEILQLALIIGLVHINIGILLALYQGHLRKEFLPALFDVSHLYFLQAIIVGLLFNQPWMIYSSLIIATTILLLRRGILGLTHITGFFGIWFSYARLLALSLATAGVALAINIIADKAAGFTLIGPILWVTILVLGHTFNFILNMIACVIHSARLHYVEQFGLFFKEGGTAFTPFKIKTKIKE